MNNVVFDITKKTGKKISKEKVKAIMETADVQLSGRYLDIYEALGAKKGSTGTNYHCFNEAGHSGGWDNQPSMGIDNETGTFHCFACGEKGNLFTYWKDHVKQGPNDQFHEFLLNELGVQWVDADEVKKEEENNEMAEQSKDVYAAFASKFKKGAGKRPEPSNDIKDATMDMADLDPYVERLLANEGAMAYLKKTRNITEPVIRKYKIGLTEPFVTNGGYKVKNSKCFTFPVISPDSQLVNIKKYNPLSKDSRFKWTYMYKKRKMWPSPVSNFACDRIYIFEGEPDTYCAISFGVPGAVTLGAAKRANPLEMLGEVLSQKYLSGKEIVICFDADEAGRAAAAALAKAVVDMASQVKIINFDKSDINPFGLDPKLTKKVVKDGKEKNKRVETDFTDFMQKNGFGDNALQIFYELVEATDAYTDSSINEGKLAEKQQAIPPYVPLSDFREYNDLGYCYISLEGKVICNLSKILNYLSNQGYRKAYLGDECTKSSLVKVVKPNVIKLCSLENSKDEITKALASLPEEVHHCIDNNEPDKCEENFYGTSTIAKYQIEARVVSVLNSYSKYEQLQEYKGMPLTDTKDTSYIPFKNGVLEVTSGSQKLKSYSHLDGFVWQGNIIDHSINLQEDPSISIFERFIGHVTDIGENSNNNKRCLENNIGYNICRYKRPTVNKISIYSDHGISSTIEGRRGKSLVFAGLSKIRKICNIDGKSFSPSRSNFIFQNVSPETDIVLIDDARPDLDIEFFFSKATGDLVVEKKGEPAFIIPREKSPKFAITTNSSVLSTGGSADARMTHVEFGDYYSSKHSPEDEFGCLLFDDWDLTEWNKFYLYIVKCLQQYLSEGLMEIKSDSAALKQLIGKTSEEFVNWMEQEVITRSPGIFEEGVITKCMKDAFCKFENLKKDSINTAIFGKWMTAYAEYKGWKKKPISKIEVKMRMNMLDKYFVMESGRGFKFVK